MPKKPRQACSYPGCPELTDSSFCEGHSKKEATRYEKYDHDLATRKRMVVLGKELTATLQLIPFFEECKRQGKLTPATEFHHILPLARGGSHDRSI